MLSSSVVSVILFILNLQLLIICLSLSFIITLTTLNYFSKNHGEQKGFFQFKIIINVLVKQPSPRRAAYCIPHGPPSKPPPPPPPLLFVYSFIYLFIETYLYRVDIISSQAMFHMCPVVILLYENNHLII